MLVTMLRACENALMCVTFSSTEVFKAIILTNTNSSCMFYYSLIYLSAHLIVALKFLRLYGGIFSKNIKLERIFLLDLLKL